MRVSLCVIAYNEQNTLSGLFENICSQNYPHNKIEIVLVNSNSKDKTLTVMNNFAKNNNDFYDIKIIQNQGHNQASGWNTAIKNSIGDIIIRVDAHAEIPFDFISKNVELIKSGEDICGGGRPNIILNPTKWKETLLLAESSMFGSSIASYRRKTNEKKYVNSLFHGAYRREVFEKCGGFNENLGRTEDNELHYRMRCNGYKLCFSPNIISYQHIRSTLRGMIKQKFGNGKWIGLTLTEAPKCLSIFHFIPFTFILSLLGSLALLIQNICLPLILVLGLYVFADIVMTVSAIIGQKFNVTYILLPVIFPILHISYGIGTLIGIILSPFWHLKLTNKAYTEIENVKEEVKLNSKR